MLPAGPAVPSDFPTPAKKLKVEHFPKVGSKIRFRPKMRAEKELRGENGAFDTETSGFGGRARASVRPENGRKVKNAEKTGGCGGSRGTKN